MFEMQGGFRVMHWHGGNDWAPMSESRDHDVSSHDPERSWLKGARIFKCASCEEQIAVAPTDSEPAADPGHPHPGV